MNVMRYRLRTLLILMGVAPPAIALLWLAPGLVAFMGLLATGIVSCIALNVALAYAFAWVISSTNRLIGRLQGK